MARLIQSIHLHVYLNEGKQIFRSEHGQFWGPIFQNVVSTSLFHCQLYNCVGYVVVEGQMNSTDFVDDISITFLYVSSSDLVLKIINSKNYHFARYKNITNKKCRRKCQIFGYATLMREHKDDTYKN